MSARYSKLGHRLDYFLLALVLLLSVVGLVVLASASSDLGKRKFNDSYYYLKHQFLYGFLPGVLCLLIASRIYYGRYRRIAFIFLLVNVGLLALVFTKFGITAGGASRWLQLGPVSFQPAELLKLSLIIYLAAWLSNPKMDRTGDLSSGLVPFLLICSIVATLLLLQPATSTVAILLASGGAVYFLSGAKIRYLVVITLIGIVALGVVVYLTPYRMERVLGYLKSEQYTQDINYQRNQAMTAIGSGKLWGVGYGQSTNKVSRLPAPIDDSIFAIAAEELGFIGAGGLIALFGMFVFRLLWLARRMRDRFGQLLLSGFASIIGLQSLVNIAAISGAIPLTGVPLPFISYGGTALAVFLAMGGIALNASKYT